jgi:preprotein translocase SecE subunit
MGAPEMDQRIAASRTSAFALQTLRYTRGRFALGGAATCCAPFGRRQRAAAAAVRVRPRSARLRCAQNEGERDDERLIESGKRTENTNGARRTNEHAETARETRASTSAAVANPGEGEALFPWISNHVDKVVDQVPKQTPNEQWDARIEREVAFMRRVKLRETSGLPAWIVFLLDLADEFRMIEWPSPKRTLRILVISVIFLVLSVSYIYVLDSVFGWLSSIFFES